MPEIGTLRTVQQGSIRIIGVTGGVLRPAKVQTAAISWEAETYSGPHTVTPSEETQVLPTHDMHLHENIIIQPIPDGYGRISYDGRIITVW